MCKQMEDLRNESILEGIDIGDLRTTVKYYKKGKITLEEAAEDLNIPGRAEGAVCTSP